MEEYLAVSERQLNTLRSNLSEIHRILDDVETNEKIEKKVKTEPKKVKKKRGRPPKKKPEVVEPVEASIPDSIDSKDLETPPEPVEKEITRDDLVILVKQALSKVGIQGDGADKQMVERVAESRQTMVRKILAKFSDEKGNPAKNISSLQTKDYAAFKYAIETEDDS